MYWFEKHLNISWTIAWVIYAMASVPKILLAQIFWLPLLLLSGWVIKEKNRSLWWILLSGVFAPVWLKNKAENKGYKYYCKECGATYKEEDVYYISEKGLLTPKCRCGSNLFTTLDKDEPVGE
jgi:hypothetical protein